MALRTPTCITQRRYAGAYRPNCSSVDHPYTRYHQRLADYLSSGNKRVHSAEHVMVDVLPRDITTLPHVLGSDLIEYLTTASAETPGRPYDWDAFAEAADVIDPDEWYTTSFDAMPDRSITRWLPSEKSGLATVAVYSQASETAVLIRYG